MIRIILWCKNENEWNRTRDDIFLKLGKVAGDYWSKSVLRGQNQEQHPDREWQERAWQAARPHDDTDQLRILERHSSKPGWFEAPTEPPWQLREKNAPAIALFYSFKGGTGRSTTLAATALQLAQAGERVAVLDADLDAPGVGSLLAGYDGVTASWGIVDYLLEQRILAEGSIITTEYRHQYPFGGAGAEGIFVCPAAGTFDRRYLDKLARIDYGRSPGEERHPFVLLLEQIRRDLEPQWILIDARAGLSDVSGFMTGGLCHFHILFGTLADASWRGLELVLERLGGDRVREDKPQAECLLAASMVPRSDEAMFQTLVARVTDRSRDVFSEHYYASPDESPDKFWTLSDLESTDAPHVPIVLPYEERLATFRDLSEVAESILLTEQPYRELTERLRSSLSRSRDQTI